jgi:hypothetical protein
VLRLWRSRCQGKWRYGKERTGKARPYDCNGSSSCWGLNTYGQSTVPFGVPGHFTFGGFYPPVEPASALNAAKAGSAIPLKFSLTSDQGLEILAISYPASQPVTCATLEAGGTLEATNLAGQSGLSYVLETGWYNYVWKTDKAWAGTFCGISTLNSRQRNPAFLKQPELFPAFGTVAAGYSGYCSPAFVRHLVPESSLRQAEIDCSVGSGLPTTRIRHQKQ